MEAAVVSIIRELLTSAGLPFSGIATDTIADQRVFRIETDNGKDLIGMRGDTIRAIDHLVKKAAEQQGIEDLHFLVDVNNYRTKQIEQIQMKARMMAERARSFQYDVELTPMSAYERLIVHATLSDMPDITTESHGEGRDRRVVIRYVSTAAVAAEQEAKI